MGCASSLDIPPNAERGKSALYADGWDNLKKKNGAPNDVDGANETTLVALAADGWSPPSDGSLKGFGCFSTLVAHRRAGEGGWGVGSQAIIGENRKDG